MYKPGREPSRQQTLYWLRWLSNKLEAESKNEFLIEKMQPNWLENNLQIRLYLIGVVLIYGLIFGLVYGLIGLTCGLIFGQSGVIPVRLTCGLIFGLIGLTRGIRVGLIFGLVGGLISAVIKNIKPVETIRWTPAKAKIGFSRGLVIGLVIGLIFGLIGVLTVGLNDNSIAVLITVLILGLFIGVIGGLFMGLMGPELQTRIVPNQGIQQSAKNAAIFTLMSWFVWVLVFELSNLAAQQSVELIPVLAGGLVLGMFCGITFCGGLACIQHFVLRLILWQSGAIPWNYARFLELATERGFVQREGGRYPINHDLLRETFADFEPVSSNRPKNLRGKEAFLGLGLAGLVLLDILLPFAADTVWIGYTNAGGTMIPTLENNENVFINKLTYVFHNPQRGDIVLFKVSESLQRQGFRKDFEYIRRVIGLPGETVEVKGGQVYINGEPLQSDYIGVPENYEYGPIKVPADYYLVLGNNPEYNYKDSFGGFVRKNYISGRVIFRNWPPTRFGHID